MDELLENLANAIVIRASNDYRHALRILKRYPESKKAYAEKQEIEEFFHSGWFKLLTKVDPDYLLKRLKAG